MDDIFFLGFSTLNNLPVKHQNLNWLFYFISDPFTYLIILGGFIYFFLQRKTYYFIGGFFSAIIARLGVAELIRMIFPHNRPFEVLKDVNLIIEPVYQSSFPSGHTIFLFAFSTFVFIYNKKIGSLFYLMSSLVGISRVIVGVHWPLDILGGAILGIVFSLLFYKVGKKIFNRAGSGI